MLKIAHRGASGYELENSIKAFKKASELGADLIELDIRETKDREFIVFHDHNFNRCTNFKGKVNHLNLDEISNKVRLNNREKIPTLLEVCTFLKENDIKALIELKKDNSALEVFDIISKFLSKDRFIIGSFFHKQILDLKKEHSDTQTCVMLEGNKGNRGNKGKCFPDDPKNYLKKLQVNYVAIGFESTNRELIESIQSAGVKVFVWTLNELIDIELAKEMGVDGIISNYPDRI